MAQRTQLLKWPGTQGLVGWWRFEGTAAKTLSVPDQTGNKNMTLVQGTSLIQDLWPTRGDRYCLGFNGLNDATRYGSMSFGTSDPAYFGTGAQTVATSITAICVAHAIGNGGNGNGRLFDYGGAIEMLLVNSSLRGNLKTTSATITGTAPSVTYLNTGRPVVFSFTYSVSDQTFRINTNSTQGTAIQNLLADNVGTNGTNSAAFRLSSQTSLASQLNGQIMELAIFKNRQLSASECYNFIYARRPSLRGSRFKELTELTSVSSTKSLSCDGVNDFAVATNADTNTLIESKSAISISFWVKFLSDTGADQRVTSARGGSGNWVYIFQVATGLTNITWGIKSSSDSLKTTSYNFVRNEWYQVVMTYDSSISTNNTKLYISGGSIDSMSKLIDQYTQTGNTSTTTDFIRIGVDNASASDSNINFDEFRIYNVALDENEIYNSFIFRKNITRGLVARWNFEEASGNATDSVAGYILTVTGATRSNDTPFLFIT